FAVAPSDSAGDVGGGHFVQLTNSVMQVWSTGGTQQFGPIATRTLFSGFGGDQCGVDTFDSVDGLVRYDELAGRWVISYVPVDFLNGQSEFHRCVAVSASSDPSGSYNRYEFNFGVFPSQPRLAVWPDGYYLTFQEFDLNSGNFLGTLSVAFDRNSMLSGGPANAIAFDLGTSNPNVFGLV